MQLLFVPWFCCTCLLLVVFQFCHKCWTWHCADEILCTYSVTTRFDTSVNCRLQNCEQTLVVCFWWIIGWYNWLLVRSKTTLRVQDVPQPLPHDDPQGTIENISVQILRKFHGSIMEMCDPLAEGHGCGNFMATPGHPGGRVPLEFRPCEAAGTTERSLPDRHGTSSRCSWRAADHLGTWVCRTLRRPWTATTVRLPNVHRARLGADAAATPERAVIPLRYPVPDSAGDPCHLLHCRPALSSGRILPTTSRAGCHSLKS